MLNAYHSQAHFLLFYLSFQLMSEIQSLPQPQQSPVSLQFPLSDAVTTTDPSPIIGLFYFQASGYLCSLVVLGQILCKGFIS